MQTDQVKRLKELEKENERLLKAVSDLPLEKLILLEAALFATCDYLDVELHASPETGSKRCTSA